MSLREMTPRRVRRDEEDELVAIATHIARTRDELDVLLVRRDQLILDLVDAQARVTDIADILQISVPAVYHALRRAKAR